MGHLLACFCPLYSLFLIPYSHNPGASGSNWVQVVWAPIQEGGLYVPPQANNHPYFQQWESKVPYKCAATPVFRLKLYCDGYLWCDFSLVVRFFFLHSWCVFVRIFYGTGVPCRDCWHRYLTRHRLGYWRTLECLGGGGRITPPPAISRTVSRRESCDAAFESSPQDAPESPKWT